MARLTDEQVAELEAKIAAAEQSGGYVEIPEGYVPLQSRQLLDGRWETWIIPVDVLMKHAKLGK